MDTLQNMGLFRELMLCGNPVYTWCYDARGTLLHSNCPNEAIIDGAFVQFGCRQRMLKYGSAHTAPLLLGTSIGLNWYAAFERRDGELLRCWLIGPVFYREISTQTIEQGLRRYSDLELSIAWKLRFLEALREIPAVSGIQFQRSVLMMHYCLNGERLEASDLTCHEDAPAVPAEAAEQRDRHRVYQAERALLDMVRNGDLNYRAALSRSMQLSTGVPVDSRDALRQSKTSVIVFASLVCRAAIEGGLSPDIAYTLSDSYIQTAENAKTLEELYPLSGALYSDFIGRVHAVRTGPQYSEPIRRCREYIGQHIEEKILAQDLAQAVGYSEYYLTQRFKKETGLSVNDYIKSAKVERAKTLLHSSDATVTEIAGQLSFSSRSYFCRVFAELTGQTPQEYRAAQQ